MHPQLGVRLRELSMHTSLHSGGTGIIRPSLRNGFNSLYVISPATNSFCHRHAADCMAHPKSRLGRMHLRDPFRPAPVSDGRWAATQFETTLVR
jgi:hypothetical protein